MIQTFKGETAIPPYPLQVDNNPGYAGFVIDAANEKAGFIVTAPRTGNIAKIGWVGGAVTTGATLDVRVETISGTPGVPSGTLWGTNTNGAQVVLDADDNTHFLTTLTAVAAVTRGQDLAVVISQPGASFGSMVVNCFSDHHSHKPYCLNNTGAWAIQTFRGPCLWFEYDDGTVWPIRGSHPFSLITNAVISTSSTPDVVGMRFRLPFPMRVSGFWFWLDLDGDATVKLVQTDYHQANNTGVLLSRALVSANRATTGPGVFLEDFTATVELAADTDYRLIVEPSTTSNVTAYYTTMGSLLQMDGWAGGRLWPYTSAKDPTADASWTNYNNGTDGFRRLISGLLFDGFGDDAGGGGGGGIIGASLIAGGN